MFFQRVPTSAVYDYNFDVLLIWLLIRGRPRAHNFREFFADLSFTIPVLI
jgi:hypothetical protein